jgi:hypothetical protein
VNPNQGSRFFVQFGRKWAHLITLSGLRVKNQ